MAVAAEKVAVKRAAAKVVEAAETSWVEAADAAAREEKAEMAVATASAVETAKEAEAAAANCVEAAVHEEEVEMVSAKALNTRDDTLAR